MWKILKIQVDPKSRSFIAATAKKERTDLSKAVRDLVSRGRTLLAVEKHKKGEASLGRATEIAGLPVGQVMLLLREFGVKGNLEQDDYRKSIANLAGAW